MLATKTTQTEAPQPPHKIDRMACFYTAVSMVQNRHRATSRRYRDILFPLVSSYENARAAASAGKPRPNAGGPAMRLAQALWDLDYRLRFPTDDALVMAEENSTAHLWHYYKNLAEGPYHISRAASAFRTLRRDMLGDLPPLPMAIQPDADATPTALCLALLDMDRAVYNPVVPTRVQHNPVLKQVLQAASTCHPLPDELPLALAKAVPDFVWYLREPTGYNFHQARQHHDPLKALQYKHRLQLQSTETALNAAVSALCRAIQPVAQD